MGNGNIRNGPVRSVPRRRPRLRAGRRPRLAPPPQRQRHLRLLHRQGLGRRRQAASQRLHLARQQPRLRVRLQADGRRDAAVQPARRPHGDTATPVARRLAVGLQKFAERGQDAADVPEQLAGGAVDLYRAAGRRVSRVAARVRRLYREDQRRKPGG